MVTELECPGYIIDETQRIIQMEANQTARFVFTNSVKPSLNLIKLSADGSRLAGVTFRIAKIEDGSRYLDRTTDENGEILISGLEPVVYSVKELDTTSDHIIDPVERHVELFPRQDLHDHPRERHPPQPDGGEAGCRHRRTRGGGRIHRQGGGRPQRG